MKIGLNKRKRKHSNQLISMILDPPFDIVYFLRIFSFFQVLYFQIFIFSPRIDFRIIGVLFSGFVGVVKEIDYIPKQYIISTHFVNCNLPKPEEDLIRFFDKKNKNTYDHVGGFSPPTPGNPTYVSGFYPELEDDLNYQSWNHNCTYVHLKNMYTNFAGSLVTENFEYIGLLGRDNWVKPHDNATVKYSYDSIIALGNRQTTYFGHWFHDVLAPLTLFPEEIVNKSLIIRYDKTECPLSTIFAFGIKKSQMLILSEGDGWIFAKNCYTTIPFPHLRHFGKMMLILYQKFSKYYNLENIIPSQYYISNRPQNLNRWISNMNDIFFAFKSKFPDINFVYLTDSMSIQESAIQWASAKFIFTPTGSNCVKTVFMKPKSIIVICLGDLTDNFSALISSSHGVYTLFFRIKTMKHYGQVDKKKGYTNECDIQLALRVCEIGIYVSKNGKWNKSETFLMK